MCNLHLQSDSYTCNHNFGAHFSPTIESTKTWLQILAKQANTFPHPFTYIFGRLFFFAK